MLFSDMFSVLQTEEEDALPAVDVKDEDANKLSGFSVHWRAPLDCEYCALAIVFKFEHLNDIYLYMI